MLFKATFETQTWKSREIEIESSSLEDATIEASNMAEEKHWELLSVDEIVEVESEE